MAINVKSHKENVIIGSKWFRYFMTIYIFVYEILYIYLLFMKFYFTYKIEQ